MLTSYEDPGTVLRPLTTPGAWKGDRAFGPETAQLPEPRLAPDPKHPRQRVMAARTTSALP